ncbi:MAG TPA: TIM barrel protein [Bryobacteraceae bacterium]|jgi:hydroxypyruvate isomerase|nr:TIM barrel protein [Bryobacteraceae bacterium]
MSKLSIERRPRTRNRLGLSVAARNFGDVPLRESLEKIANIGFDTCDNFDWRDAELFAEYKVLLKEFDLGAGVLVVNKKPDVNALGCSLVSPEDREGFLKELRLCIEAAKTVHCNRLEVLTGNCLSGVSRETQMDNCVATLQAAVPLLEANRMTAIVELLNSNVDHPGYFLNTVEDGVEIVQRTGSPHVKLLLDIYHVQVMQGNLIQRIRDSFQEVGQYHFADVPGRHQPGTGEINFRNVFRAIYDLKYDGFITAEYHPTDFTFRDLELVRDLATFSEEDSV